MGPRYVDCFLSSTLGICGDFRAFCVRFRRYRRFLRILYIVSPLFCGNSHLLFGCLGDLHAIGMIFIWLLGGFTRGRGGLRVTGGFIRLLGGFTRC